MVLSFKVEAPGLENKKQEKSEFVRSDGLFHVWFFSSLNEH